MTPRLRHNMPWGKTVQACRHDGFRSTIAWLQLQTLGFRDVRVYNGDWGDWGTNLSLPVVQGDAPYDEVFGL